MTTLQSLQLEPGGRPVANDDFQVLQDRDAALGLPALLTGLGPCLVSGCRVSMTGSQYNVGAGVVWVGSRLLPFAGRSNVTLPAMFAPGTVVVVDERAYQTGGTKTTIKGQSMDLVPVVAGAPNLVIDTWGCLTFWHLIKASSYEVGDVKQSANLTTANYDATGLGKPGSSAWGWALCNGQNGTADTRGQFVMAFNPDRTGGPQGLTTNAIGDTGGEAKHTLTVGELPRHNPVISRVADPGGPNDGSVLLKGGDPGNGSLFSLSLPAIGNSQPHENLPPFYVLAMLQWVGY